MTSKEALQEFYNRVTNEAIDNAKYLGEAVESIQYWQEKYYIIEKELMVLEMLKKKMTIETDYYDSDVGCEKYEYIAYNGTALNIDTPEEFELLKEVLENE